MEILRKGNIVIEKEIYYAECNCCMAIFSADDKEISGNLNANNKGFIRSGILCPECTSSRLVFHEKKTLKGKEIWDQIPF